MGACSAVAAATGTTAVTAVAAITSAARVKKTAEPAVTEAPTHFRVDSCAGTPGHNHLTQRSAVFWGASSLDERDGP